MESFDLIGSFSLSLSRQLISGQAVCLILHNLHVQKKYVFNVCNYYTYISMYTQYYKLNQKLGGGGTINGKNGDGK